MTVLVADDQQCQLDLISRQLSRAGYRVICCHSGEEAVDKLKSQKVDIVITDMEMDSMTGEQVLKHVREGFGSLPVILMSGNSDNLKKKGFDGYLEKPFLKQELLTVVEKLRQ